MKIKGLTISESEFRLENGRMGKIAVFIYCGDRDPSGILDMAVREYVKDSKKETHELMDANLDNPWMRAVVSEINDMFQEVYDSEQHHVDKKSIETIREEKLKTLEEWK